MVMRMSDTLYIYLIEHKLQAWSVGKTNKKLVDYMSPTVSNITQPLVVHRSKADT